MRRGPADYTPDTVRNRLVEYTICACRLLASQPHTLDALGAALGFSGRSARRLVYSLRRAGVDVLAVDREGPRQAIRYAIDRRQWLALLDLPRDGARSVSRDNRADSPRSTHHA